MKVRRESRPPEHNALRSRGCPDPDRAIYVKRMPASSRPRRTGKAKPVEMPYAVALLRLEREMASAQSAVRRLKADGEDHSHAAIISRGLRARWLELTGGLVGHDVEPAGYQAASR